jgi:hypothetical protein
MAVVDYLLVFFDVLRSVAAEGFDVSVYTLPPYSE